MKKLPYELWGPFAITDCPYVYDKAVGSKGCVKCEHHVSEGPVELAVICSHPYSLQDSYPEPRKPNDDQ